MNYYCIEYCTDVTVILNNPNHVFIFPVLQLHYNTYYHQHTHIHTHIKPMALLRATLSLTVSLSITLSLCLSITLSHFLFQSLSHFIFQSLSHSYKWLEGHKKRPAQTVEKIFTVEIKSAHYVNIHSQTMWDSKRKWTNSKASRSSGCHPWLKTESSPTFLMTPPFWYVVYRIISFTKSVKSSFITLTEDYKLTGIASHPQY